VNSFSAIDDALIGGSKNWLEVATSLRALNHLDDAALETVRFVSTFGSLIANTDQHLGNLACIDLYDGRFNLAPIYDMLPMLFAPSHHEMVVRAFNPPQPSAVTMRAWGRSREVAQEYWQRLAKDQRISGEFREICAACFSTLNALPRTGAYGYES
jgi:HipA-like C-terminal domain